MATNNPDTEIDWSVTTWEGSRRAQLRGGCALTLRERLQALEGMADISGHSADMRAQGRFRDLSKHPEGSAPETPSGNDRVREPPTDYSPSPPACEIVLHGCTPEPLMSYLKALGILRLVGEQVDAKARGFWRDGIFVIHSTQSEVALLDFFLRHYRPTPIVVPWSGNDYFNVNRNVVDCVFKKTPSGAKVIEAFLATRGDRLSEYQRTIHDVFDAMEVKGIEKKEHMGKPVRKARYIEELRAMAGSNVVNWIDAAAIIGEDKSTFSSLLGSGGGSDGNTHFSDNFMQNLWEVLPEFSSQRAKKTSKVRALEEDMQIEHSLDLLRSALYGEPVSHLVEERTSSLFDSGAVGGPNATQGMERESLTNPWNFILGLEGTLFFAGSLAKRTGSTRTITTFPFQFQFTVAESERAALKEQAGREAWVPLWDKPTTAGELRLLLSEGRAEIGRKNVYRGVDMARAVTGLGVDRGISGFQRFAIVKGRVGGDNYNTAVSLGRFDVRLRQNGDLLLQVDSWLDTFRRACGDKTPARIITALRRIDGAILDYCRYGGNRYFQAILMALGRAERELMRDNSWADKNRVSPLSGLSPEWITAADDGSTEFDLALALSSIYDAHFKLGSLRTNLEPVNVDRRKNGFSFAKWAEKDRAVVWNSADLSTNLAKALARRLMDGNRKGCESLPIASRYTATLDAISAFLAHGTDDRRVEELLWGLILIDARDQHQKPRSGRRIEAPPLPRAYALLKLLFLPRSLIHYRDRDGRPRWRYARSGEQGIEVHAEPRILPLLLARRIEEACGIAMRRLRASGLSPMPNGSLRGHARGSVWEVLDHALDGPRLAGAVLIPIGPYSVNRLIHLVTRQHVKADAEFVAA